MAGNRRGKLKEHFEGIHRNFDWSITHVTTSLQLIGDEKHPLHEAMKALGEGIQTLDGLAMQIYSKL